MMATGRVKWFEPGKDYGFIVPDAGGGDVFLRPGLRSPETNARLTRGAPVRFRMEFGEGGKASATNVIVLPAIR